MFDGNWSGTFPCYLKDKNRNEIARDKTTSHLHEYIQMCIFKQSKESNFFPISTTKLKWKRVHLVRTPFGKDKQRTSKLSMYSKSKVYKSKHSLTKTYITAINARRYSLIDKSATSVKADRLCSSVGTMLFSRGISSS